MPKNVPAFKPRKLINFLERGGCNFCREGKQDHRLYSCDFEGKKSVVSEAIGEARLLSFPQQAIATRVLRKSLSQFRQWR